MNRTLRVVLFLLLVVAVVWWWRSRNSANTAPEHNVAGHVKAMCKIARNNINTPEPGVTELFGYLGTHSPDMMHEFVATLVAIERIDDDAKHDARARKAAQRLRKPFVKCARTFDEFFTAVERNPKAAQKLERGLERFGRTLEIIFQVENPREKLTYLLGYSL